MSSFMVANQELHQGRYKVTEVHVGYSKMPALRGMNRPVLKLRFCDVNSTLKKKQAKPQWNFRRFCTVNHYDRC